MYKKGTKVKSGFIRTYTNSYTVLSTSAIEYNECISVERSEPTPTKVLGVTLNHQTVRLQSLKFGECGVPFIAITITLRSTLTWSGLIYESNRVNSLIIYYT